MIEEEQGRPDRKREIKRPSYDSVQVTKDDSLNTKTKFNIKIFPTP
jgi:hypothetical protein